MNRNLLIAGLEEYRDIVSEVAEAMGCFEKISFYSTSADRNEDFKKILLNLEDFIGDYSYAAAASDSRQTLELIRALEEYSFSLPPLVHPDSHIDPTAGLLKGCIISSGSQIESGSTIGIGSVLYSGCRIGHDSFIGDACRLGENSTVPPFSLVWMGTELASGAVYRQTGARRSHLYNKGE